MFVCPVLNNTNILCKIGHHYDPLFKEALKNLAPDALVLNIACEDNLCPDFLKNRIKPQNVFGVELDKSITQKNSQILFCNVDQQKLPFADNHFELIISIWGLEHFRTSRVFKECQRVLKPGGKFIFLTPNLRQPIFFLNKLLAGKFSKPYFKYVLRTQYRPHATYYRFNSLRQLKKAAHINNLNLKNITYFGPSYLIYYFNFSKVLQHLVKLLDRAISNRFLFKFKPYLFAVLEKE